MVTGQRVASLDDLPPARAVLFDLTPRQLVAVAGDRLPARARRRLGRFRYGPGSFKIDYALDGPVPWTAEGCSRAGSVHVGGTLDEVVAAERDVAQGRHPERPFVLTAQPSLFDATRAPEGKHTFWAYCHVPHGSTVDMTEAVEAQIERFAPGFRDRVLARHTMFPADLERHNANNVGGDVAGGSHGGLQLIARPRLAADPYSLPIDGHGRLPVLGVDAAGGRRPRDVRLVGGPVRPQGPRPDEEGPLVAGPAGTAGSDVVRLVDGDPSRVVERCRRGRAAVASEAEAAVACDHPGQAGAQVEHPHQGEVLGGVDQRSPNRHRRRLLGDVGSHALA